MSDLMLFSVLRMPYDMAMSDELSRRQFYDRAQQAAAEIEQWKSLVGQMILRCADNGVALDDLFGQDGDIFYPLKRS